VSRLELFAVEGLPEVRPGDDIAGLIEAHGSVLSGDVIVVAQKIVSKAEGRVRDLASVKAGDRAVAIAAKLVARPDPRLVQLVLDESVRVLREDRVLITETRHGYVCANSGIDQSNIPGDGIVTLLPEDPDASALGIRERLRASRGVNVGVIVSDTFGRPWRLGIVNVALGVAGFGPLVDLRGEPDDVGRDMHATVLAVADDIASAAGLVMRKTARSPVVVVRGLELEGDGTGRDLVRPADEDVFR
jgi:coenzyme F420-0:L-glutamate ligase/coenzyme F420-1:gamma-L-glutamate ligase